MESVGFDFDSVGGFSSTARLFPFLLGGWYGRSSASDFLVFQVRVVTEDLVNLSGNLGEVGSEGSSWAGGGVFVIPILRS